MKFSNLFRRQGELRNRYPFIKPFLILAATGKVLVTLHCFKCTPLQKCDSHSDTELFPHCLRGRDRTPRRVPSFCLEKHCLHIFGSVHHDTVGQNRKRSISVYHSILLQLFLLLLIQWDVKVARQHRLPQKADNRERISPWNIFERPREFLIGVRSGPAEPSSAPVKKYIPLRKAT